MIIKDKKIAGTPLVKTVAKRSFFLSVVAKNGQFQVESQVNP